MKLKTLVLATLLTVTATASYAGNFVQLTNGNGTILSTVNGGIKSGAQNPNADQFHLLVQDATYLAGYEASNPNGFVVASTIDYATHVGNPNNPANIKSTGTLTLLDWRVTTGVDLSPGSKQATVYDFVYQDSADGKLVFATRYLNQVANNEEANFLYRYNFSTTGTYTPQVAWLFSSDNDLRLYEAALTDDHSFNSVVSYNQNVVRQKGDFSVSEGNPWSGLFLVKTDAQYYSLGSKAIGYFQAGEEGQPVVGGFISGFVASATAVPEPQSYALMMAGLSLVGIAARRRKNQGAA
ncbi:PEP-CTERM sorting domain-containing protein [Methylophilus luteus]|uniref:PEP-CTERM sorting domain-containing protein n=1 Tax=Methylophilus luteus TaxID=640108 RepID=A0ABW3F3X3_9PROT